MIVAGVTSDQRWSRSNPCPICQGWPGLPRGQGRRCHGFLSADGRYAHCARGEHAGAIELGRDGLYAHFLDGDCRCGRNHGTSSSTGGRPAGAGDAGEKLAVSRARETRYEIRDLDGQLHAVHVRIDQTDGSKALWWELPGGKKGLGGRRVETLPLYGSEGLRDLDDGAAVVVTEGEKACEALRRRGIAAVATVTGAKLIPADETLWPVLRFQVVVWPDNDADGARHMERIAARLRALGAQPRVVAWSGALRKGDAADFEGSDEELRELLDGAQVWESTETSTSRVLGGDGVGAVLVNLSDVQREEVRWRWPLRLPIGKLTIIEGDPGTGKSFLTMAITTAVTLGEPLPGDSECYEPNRVLVLTAEDSLADTMRPRLEDMGADLTLVKSLTGVRDADGRERFPNLSDDLMSIESVLSAGGYGLVVIDPINAYLRGVDGHKDTDIRSVLGPLSQLAERYGVAVICVRHLTKGGRDKSIYRGLGGIGYTAAARSVLLVGVHPDTPTERIIICHKHNLAPDSAAISFEIREGRFLWRGESSVTAAQLLAPEQGGEERSAYDEAVAFLRETLADGPRLAKEVEQEAREMSIAPRTLRRARTALGVVARRRGEQGQRGAGGWWWELPPEPVNVSKDIKAAKVSNSEELAALIPTESTNGAGAKDDGRLNPPARGDPVICGDCGAVILGTCTHCVSCMAKRSRLVADALKWGARQVCWKCGGAEGSSEGCWACVSANQVEEHQAVLLE